MSSDSTLRGERMECTFLPCLGVSIASLFSPHPSLFTRNLSTFLFFFPSRRCPILIYPFYLPPVFGAISSPLRLSLILMSPGFLSPEEPSRKVWEGSRSGGQRCHGHVPRAAPDGSESFRFGGIPVHHTCDPPHLRYLMAKRQHSANGTHSWVCHTLVIHTQHLQRS